MKLPDIDYSAPVQESSSAIARVSRAQREAIDTIGAGLQAFSQEMIKTQTQKATADVEAGMAADDAELAAKRYLPVDQVKAELGDGFDQLPPDIQAHRETVKDAQGNDVEVVPTYLVAGTLFEKRTKDRILAASKGITGQGWQADFQDAALKDLSQRKRAMAITQAHAMVADFKQTQSATVDQYMRAGSYDRALETIDHSDAFEPGEKAQLREQVLATKQKSDAAVAKVAQAAQVEAASSSIVQAARVPGYKWVDPAKALSAVDAIPDSNPAKEDVRRLVEHQVEKAEQLRELAGKDQMNHAQALLNGGYSLESTQLAPVKAWMLDPANGAADKWDALQRGVAAERRANRTVANAADAEARRLALEERRQQSERDQQAVADFDAMPLKGDSGKDQVSGDLRTLFPDASPLALSKIAARQKKANEAWAKDQGVSRQAYVDQVNGTALSLGYGKKDSAAFRSYMLDQLAARPDPAKPVTSDEVDKLLVDAVTYADVPHGRDKENWRLRREGETVPPPAADQPERVRAVTGKRSAPAAATAPAGAPARKVVGGKTYEKRADGWYEVP